jgi:uncharacterized repeat protein (TIGR03803 family)
MPRKKLSVRSVRCISMLSVFMALFILAFAAVVTPSVQAQTFTVLHAFTGAPDGGFPGNGGLILDAKGNVYGTTSEGGTGACSGGCGTVFKLNTAGKETVLYSFTGTNGDGKYPQGGLVQDAAGNLYGTTFGGGTSGTACNGYGCGTVFMLDSARQETVLYSFTGGVDGATPIAGVVRDAAGNLYGTTHLGGAFNWGTVFMVDTSGNETVLHSFDGLTGDGGDAYGGLILDAAGTLYGTTQGGGNVNFNCLPGLEMGCGTVFQITTTGTETVLYAFAGRADGNTPSGNVALDNAGNLYGTSQPRPTPTGGGTIFRLDSTGKFRVLHTFTGGAGGADPFAGLVRDSAGNLYGTTYQGGGGGATCQTFLGGCGTAFKLSHAGTFTVLHSFTGGKDGGWLFAPLVLDTKGNLYGTATIGGIGDGTVFKITP